MNPDQLKNLTPSEWHEIALNLSVKCQEQSAEKPKTQPGDIIRSALGIIHHDALIQHRAIKVVVLEGWSSAGIGMVRTSLDLLVSAYAILNSSDLYLSAFRYFFSSHRALSRDQSNDSEFRSWHRKDLADRIAQLPEKDREPAKNFLKEPDRSYWFAPEWPNPSAVLEKHGLPGYDSVYRQISAGAHGGFLGLRVFRDESDEININPRLPVGYKGFAVMIASTRIIFELCRLRIDHENLGLTRECYVLTKQFNAWGRKRGGGSSDTSA